MTPWVVLVDPYSSGADFGPHFDEAGARCAAVLSTRKPPEVYASTWYPERYPTVFFGGDAALVSRLTSLAPRAVIAGTESGVVLADRLAALITPDWANDPATAAARRHKARMQERLAAVGLAHIRQVCTGTESEVWAWLDGFAELPTLILKPPASAGTDSVVRVPPGGDWRTPFRRLLGSTDRLGGSNDEVLVQEFVTGVEYAVDTVSLRGRHTVNAISRYHKTTNGGRVAIYDALEILPFDTIGHKRLVNYVRAVLDAVGIRNGPAHSEVMMTGSGPVLIETTPRTHGGRHPVHCRMATGESQLTRTVTAALGHDLPDDGYRLRRHVAVLFLTAHHAGRVRDHRCLDALRGLPSFERVDIGVAAGTVVPETENLFGVLGRVLLSHDSTEQVRRDLGAARRIAAGLVQPPGTPTVHPDRHR